MKKKFFIDKKGTFMSDRYLCSLCGKTPTPYYAEGQDLCVSCAIPENKHKILKNIIDAYAAHGDNYFNPK